MLKGVIFDLDGVVVDSHPSHIRVWKTFLCSLGRQVTEAELQFVREGGRKEEILRYFLGNLTDDQIIAYGREKERLFFGEVQNLNTIPGLRRFLEELRGAAMPAAVASNGSAARVHCILNALSLGTLFSAVVTINEVAIGKPHPAIFQRAAQQLQLSPFEVLVFEDSAAGVLAAKAAGMTCLGIADYQRAAVLQQAGADRVFPDFTHISLGDLQEVLSWPL
jgi:HAD superfamily hydrolase (TIGR01509 family)